MKIKHKNIKYKEIGPGGAFSKRGGVNSEPGPSPAHHTSSSTSVFQKTRAPVPNMNILHTSSIAKIHNIKVVELFKTNPTI